MTFKLYILDLVLLAYKDNENKLYGFMPNDVEHRASLFFPDSLGGKISAKRFNHHHLDLNNSCLSIEGVQGPDGISASTQRPADAKIPKLDASGKPDSSSNSLGWLVSFPELSDHPNAGKMKPGAYKDNQAQALGIGARLEVGAPLAKGTAKVERFSTNESGLQLEKRKFQDIHNVKSTKFKPRVIASYVVIELEMPPGGITFKKKDFDTGNEETITVTPTDPQYAVLGNISLDDTKFHFRHYYKLIEWSGPLYHPKDVGPETNAVAPHNHFVGDLLGEIREEADFSPFSDGPNDLRFCAPAKADP